MLYVGKATSLRSRVRSYFDGALAAKRGPIVDKAIRDATAVTVEETDSVLEALIREAACIKKYAPYGNRQLKDDKSFNYVVITKEAYPRILVLRGRELDAKAPRALRAHIFGPFTSGVALRDALQIVRKIFPFYDAKSTTEHARRFYRELGLSPGEDQRAYRRTIRSIVLLFSGKKRELIRSLERQMHAAARSERFESAATLRRQLFALTHIQDTALIKDEYRTPQGPGFRIEAFDTAHLRGEAPRAVMTVVENGEPDPREYRVFTIRTAKESDDYQALREVLARRFAHHEWAHPHLIVIDGGAAHLKVARSVLSGVTDAEVCAVVKDERHRPRQILGKSSMTSVHEKAILLANAEAHRFSLSRHRRALRSARR